MARLNANILYLCYTQRVRLTSLCPTHTLENIQRLLSPEYSDLGRIGAVDVSDGFRYIDSQLLQDLLTGGDDKSDGEFNNFTLPLVMQHDEEFLILTILSFQAKLLSLYREFGLLLSCNIFEHFRFLSSPTRSY